MIFKTAETVFFFYFDVVTINILIVKVLNIFKTQQFELNYGRFTEM